MTHDKFAAFRTTSTTRTTPRPKRWHRPTEAMMTLQAVPGRSPIDDQIEVEAQTIFGFQVSNGPLPPLEQLPPDLMLTTMQAAAALDCSVQALGHSRTRGIGPRFIKSSEYSRSVFYKVADILEWKAAQQT